MGTFDIVSNATPETSHFTIEPNNGYYTEEQAPPPKSLPADSFTVVNFDVPLDVAIATGIQVDFEVALNDPV